MTEIPASSRYQRILLKLSGEALMADREYGIDDARLAKYAEEIASIANMGVEVAIVIGGGNIFRGVQGVAKGIDRVQGDHMGMLATLMNSLALQDSMEKAGVDARVMSAISVHAASSCPRIFRASTPSAASNSRAP